MQSTPTTLLAIDDEETKNALHRMHIESAVLQNRFENITTIVIVFSSRVMAYDTSALVRIAHHSYPHAAIFLKNTSGEAYGPAAPHRVDLLIDLTGPYQRQSWYVVWQFHRQARHTVGRDVSWIRKYFYERVVKEHQDSQPQLDWIEHDLQLQKNTLMLGGIALTGFGIPKDDLSKPTHRNTSSS